MRAAPTRLVKQARPLPSPRTAGSAAVHRASGSRPAAGAGPEQGKAATRRDLDTPGSSRRRCGASLLSGLACEIEEFPAKWKDFLRNQRISCQSGGLRVRGEGCRSAPVFCGIFVCLRFRGAKSTIPRRRLSGGLPRLGCRRRRNPQRRSGRSPHRKKPRRWRFSVLAHACQRSHQEGGVIIVEINTAVVVPSLVVETFLVSDGKS